MQKRIALPLLVLAAIVLGGWPSVNLGGGVEASGPCSTPVNPGDLEMNFESSSGGSAVDSCTDDQSTVGMFARDPDCTSLGNCPITDDTSGRMYDFGFLADFSGTNAADVTLDFRFSYEEDTGIVYQELLGTGLAAWAPNCGALFKGNSGQVQIVCNSGAADESASSAVAVDTEYNGRIMRAGDDDDCWLKVDTTASGDWGEGAVADLFCDGASAEDSTGWDMSTTYDDPRVIDDIGRCLTLALGNEKCGREAEAD